jgi:hypothetical protein
MYSRMDEVLAHPMTRKPEPIEWEENTTTGAAVLEEVDCDTGGALHSVDPARGPVTARFKGLWD